MFKQSSDERPTGSLPIAKAIQPAAGNVTRWRAGLVAPHRQPKRPSAERTIMERRRSAGPGMRTIRRQRDIGMNVKIDLPLQVALIANDGEIYRMGPPFGHSERERQLMGRAMKSWGERLLREESELRMIVILDVPGALTPALPPF